VETITEAAPHVRGSSPQGPLQEQRGADLERGSQEDPPPSEEVAIMVSSRGGKYGFVYASRQKVYRALRRHGMTKQQAARIANGGRTHGQRSAMSRKAARTRKARGRRR
jgi:hypothetical protein